MPDDCNGYVEWVTWEKTSAATYRWTGATPTGAPAARKSVADQTTGLDTEAAADAQRKNERETWCPRGCKESAPADSPTPFPGQTVRYGWTEQYQGQDAQGNTVTLTATYTAYGNADFVKHRYRKECSPDAFGNVSWSLGDLKVKISAQRLAALSPVDLHVALQEQGLLEEVLEILS